MKVLLQYVTLIWTDPYVATVYLIGLVLSSIVLWRSSHSVWQDDEGRIVDERFKLRFQVGGLSLVWPIVVGIAIPSFAIYALGYASEKLSNLIQVLARPTVTEPPETPGQEESESV